MLNTPTQNSRPDQTLSRNMTLLAHHELGGFGGMGEGIGMQKTADGRRILLLAEGRLVNLGAAEGHPASVMDMSFSDQALTAEYLVKEAKNLPAGVHEVPTYIDKEVASLKLKSMGGRIDTLTPAQDMYLNSWEHGS